MTPRCVDPPGLSFTWLGTAGFEVRGPGLDLIFDPYISRPPGARPVAFRAFEDFAAARNILLGHGHFDHAVDVPRLLDVAPGATVYASRGVIEVLARHGVDRSRTRSLEPGETFNLGSARVTALPTRHTRFDIPLVLRTLARVRPRHIRWLWPLKDWPCAGALSFRVETAHGSFMHMSTCEPTEAELDRLDQDPVDLLLIPLQGHTHIEELAFRIVDRLSPGAVLVHHQDDFAPPISQEVDVEPFRLLMKKNRPGIPIHTINHNETMTFTFAPRAKESVQ